VIGPKIPEMMYPARMVVTRIEPTAAAVRR
jgi:hypothetical protein